MTKDWYSAIEKMGKGMVAEKLESVKESLLSLPSPSLNWALGGGLAFGKIVTIYGPEQSGKSLIAQLAIAELHRTDPNAWALWYDAEFSFDKDYAAKLGVDVRRLWLIQSNKPADIFDHFVDEVWPMMQGATGDEPFPLKIMVIDSVKSIRGPLEAEKDSVENRVIGDLSGLLNKAFRKIIEPIRKHKVLTICVQQVNEEMDQTKQHMGLKWHVPGGQALKHFSDYMLLVEKIEGKATKLFDETCKTIHNMPIQLGHRIRCKVDKNRTANPHLVAEFHLRYGVGVVNTELEIAELAVNQRVIEHKEGASWYKIGDKKIIGFSNLVELLKQTPELQRELVLALNKKRDNELFAKHLAVAVAVADENKE